VLSQDYSPIEYIIVDGDSTDRTLDVAREFENYVSLIISEPDGGIYDGMNKGIKLASGDIIGFLNSDDFYSSSSSLTKVMGVFRNTSTMSCYGDLCYVNNQDTSKITRYWESSQFVLGNFARGWSPPHPTFFVRSEIYEKYGDFDLSYKIAADIELMMRFLEHYSISVEYISEILVHMRMGGKTNKSVKNIILQNIEIWNALKKHNLKNNLIDFAKGKLFSRSKQYLTRPSIQ